jgi:hypothetical protein
MKNIASSFALPNGSVLKNRIAKSAMSENFGTRNQAPSMGLINAYKVWAKGNPGLLITGNVMVDSKALGEARNVVVEDYKDFELLKKWAKSVEGTGVHLWPQINHPGRQAFAAINRETVAPSAISLSLGSASKMFKIPKVLSDEEIWSNEIILSNYLTKNKPKKIKYKLRKGKNILKIKATSVGTLPPNTARFELIDNKIKYPIITELKLNKTAEIIILK